MESSHPMATRLWPIPAAAMISLALFWAIAFASQQLTRWVLTHAVGHRSPFFTIVPVFSALIPAMVIAVRGQKQKQAQRKHPRASGNF
jgi:hypothetical protein